MTQLMDYAGYLAKEIGPRPAGTEEEQQAALYITEQIQKEAGFATSIEEFSKSSNLEASRAILASVTIVVTILAMLLPVLVIPAFILVAAAAVVYTLEAFDRPVISRVLSQGASQNVIAKYQPNADGSEESGKSRVRSRKIVLVAHYDTDRVKPALVDRVESTGLPIPLICLAAMIAAAFFALIRVFVASGGGMGLLVLNVLSILTLLVCALPVARALLMRNAPYNEGANNNATGSAALIEIARRIARGSVSEADLAQNADDDLHIHGEAAAREAGLIPEGVQIRYEAERLIPPSDLGNYDEEERLLSAKAAIAALTGKPVERRVYGSVADKLVNSYAGDSEADFVDPSYYVEADGMPIAAPAGASDVVDVESAEANTAADGFENAPSWFIAAQKNAKRADDSSEPAQIQRSKYTEAMEYAERERAERAEETRIAEQAQREAELRAREQEARAAIEANTQVPIAPGSEVALAANDAAFDGTIAMEAPVPAAEIVAEVAAIEVGDAGSRESGSPSAPVLALDHGNERPGRAVADIPMVIDEPVARDRITSLPSIDPAAPAGHRSSSVSPEPVSSPSRSGILRKLRTSVPSLSGLIDPVGKSDRSASHATRPSGESPAVQANRAEARRAAASSVPAVVSVPSPVSNPALAEDPVDYNMEIPRSRAGNLLDRLRGNDSEDLTDTPQEWLNIDDDFEARTVGRNRGSWESFRDDQYFDDDDVDSFGADGDERRTRRRWQGGAYSRMQLGHVNTRSGADSDADSVIPAELSEGEVDRTITGEIEQIYHFRNPQFNTEIWFVAMGADGEDHDGARAFLEEHADELRGSMVIEIESLGAGTLAVASEEGRIRKMAASSRVKRYTRGAVAATGIALNEVSLAGSDSIASIAQKAGYQSMHLFGAENGHPALKGSADDVLGNIDELLFDDHVNFIFELLKH